MRAFFPSYTLLVENHVVEKLRALICNTRVGRFVVLLCILRFEF